MTQNNSQKLVYSPHDFQGNPASVALDPKMLTDEGHVVFKRLALKGQPRDAQQDYAVKYDRDYVFWRFKCYLDALQITDINSVEDFNLQLEDYLRGLRESNDYEPSI